MVAGKQARRTWTNRLVIVCGRFASAGRSGGGSPEKFLRFGSGIAGRALVTFLQSISQHGVPTAKADS